MNTNTFNSVEFQTLVNNFKSRQQVLSKTLSKVSNEATWASSSYRSEDSNLANAYSGIASTLTSANNKIQTIMTELNRLLIKYMEDTIANEEETKTEIADDASELDAISNTLNSI